MGFDSDRNYPFPNTLTMYFQDLKVKKKSYDVKVRLVAPFSWFSIQGPENPKDKKYKPLTSTPTGQSEEPVAVESSVEPSTKLPSVPAFTVSDDLPLRPSSSAGPCTSAG